MLTIIFESHGTTFDNEDHLASGHFDVDLSPLGEKQAKELGERYQDQVPDLIFCSDLKRSYKTAEIAFTGKNIQIIKDPRLRECNYGELTRHASTEVEPLRVSHITEPFPQGESYQEAADRMKEFLNSVFSMYDGKRVMVVGHRATQYGLEHWLKGVSLDQAVSASWQWQPGWVYQMESKLEI